MQYLKIFDLYDISLLVEYLSICIDKTRVPDVTLATSRLSSVVYVCLYFIYASKLYVRVYARKNYATVEMMSAGLLNQFTTVKSRIEKARMSGVLVLRQSKLS